MSLNLDDRQRAMLAEMGVHVWSPADAAEPASEPEHAPAPAPARTQAPAPVAVPAPVPATAAADAPAIELLEPAALPPASTATSALPPSRTGAPATGRPLPPATPAAPGPDSLLPLAEGIDAMDWDELQRSVQQCQACAMCLGRRAPVPTAAAPGLRADWLIVGEPPDDAQERAGQPCVDEAGRLLDNMLAAVGVRRWRADDPAPAEPAALAGLSLVLKCRPALPTLPDGQALAACAHYLRREIALLQPKVIVAMGRLAMQVLLSEAHPQGLQLPLGKLRGQVWRYQGVPVVVSYPAAYLLRQGQDKGRAWEDLCLARAVARGQL